MTFNFHTENDLSYILPDYHRTSFFPFHGARGIRDVDAIINYISLNESLTEEQFFYKLRPEFNRKPISE